MGRPYKGAVIPYGETVMLLVPQGAKGKPRFVQGQVLGKVMSSDQWIGCTSSGRLVLARTARRLSPEFSPQDPKLLKDHPWKHPGFIAGSAGRVRVQREPKVELPSGLSPLLADGDQGQLGAGGGELIEEGRPTAPGDDGDETSINYSPSPVPSAAPGAVAPATVATDAVNSDSDALSSDTTPAESVAPVVPEVPAAPMDLSDPPSREQPALDEDDRAKRARIAEISFEHGEEDPVEFTQEDCESMFDHDNDVDDSKPDEEPASGVPLELYRPYGPEEPNLSQAELDSLDALADQHEISRLLGMTVLKKGSPLSSALKVLSTRFVRTWRVKPHPVTGQPSYLRRSRLVAREFARDDPARSGLYSPASQQLLTRLLPAVWSARPDHVMFSLDVADAYLCVEQPAEMWVSLYGDQYQLLRLLPGQREGSARWYDMFSAALAEAGATAWPACPALFRLKGGQGAGLTHVDDLLGEGILDALQKLVDFLRSKFSCSVQFLVKAGDSISFLKREHILTTDRMLIIRSHPKHLERLMEVTGVRHGCAGKKTPLPLLVPDLAESPSLNAEQFSKYRTAVGILLSVCHQGSEPKPRQPNTSLLVHVETPGSSHGKYVQLGPVDATCRARCWCTGAVPGT